MKTKQAVAELLLTLSEARAALAESKAPYFIMSAIDSRILDLLAKLREA